MKQTSLLRFLLFIFTISSFKTFSQDASAVQKIKDYAAQNPQSLGMSPEDVSKLAVTSQYVDPTTGIEHIYATQKLNGLTITNTNFSLHTSGSSKVASKRIISSKDYNIQPVVVNITAKDAVLELMDNISYKLERTIDLKQPEQGEEKFTVFKRSISPIWDVPVRLVYYNNERLKALQAAWEVQMLDVERKHYWVAYVDASSGVILEKRDLIKHCDFGGPVTDANAFYESTSADNTTKATSINPEVRDNSPLRTSALPNNKYRVYDIPFENPIDPGATHSLSSKSGDTLASPDGWHKVNSITYNYTHGNNVWAFQDPSPTPLGGVPSADPTRTAFPTNTTLGVYPVTEPFIFDYPINLNNEPETYQKAAIVNLFYWNNLMHDVFYYMGFTEAAANFEESHVFSTGLRGGTGRSGDEVLAQAQDGGGTNNANFLAPPDGTNGQMQMYLWTAAFPDSLVQITSSSTGTPPPGAKYIAYQGSFNTTDTARANLYTHPVLNKQFVLIQKSPLSTVGSSSEGCSTGQQSIALPPANNVQDKIVLIDRGTCSFAEKVLSAQEGGAAGVIIINNVDGPPISMGGTDAPGNVILIPAVMISKSDGEVLKAQINAGAIIIGSLKRNLPPAPKRDGDIDNGVISHEYGHGISGRLTGGPNSVLPLGGDEQGGEGWSDFVALYMTLRNNDLVASGIHPNGVLPNRSIGNYVTYQPYDGRGIREYPYSTDMSVNPATFSYIKRPDYSETHSVGFVWCSMLYEMLQSFIDVYGMNDNVYEGANPTASHNPPATAKGNNIATRLVIEGMKLQPTSPTFIDERDAILKADTLLYNAQHSCMIWKAFAKRGLGYSAASGTNGLGDEFEAFDLPFNCDKTQTRVKVNKSGPVKATNGSTISYTIKVTNLFPSALNGVVVTDTLPAGLTFQSASDNPVVTGNLVKWTINLTDTASKTLTLVTKVSLASSTTVSFDDDNEGTASNWVATNMGGLDTWTRKTDASQAFSGSNYWFVPDTDLGGSNTTLRTTNPIAIPSNAELVFIHKYASESGYDGGVVEISTDGTTWSYLPASKFVRNGYTGIIPTANNPSIGTSDLMAFTGVSDGYIASIAKLDDYANKTIYIRFRFTADATGGSVSNGGWWMDDVYILVNRTEIANTATAITNPAAATTERQGTNARSASANSFVIGGTALASNLGALTAAVSGRSVNLSWKVYNETNTANFDIERKSSSQDNFTKIGNVTAASGSLNNSYTFSDASAVIGRQYQYRVKQVNKTGEFYYTNIALVSFGGKTFNVSIYPNPANDIANISITNPVSGKVSINLFDATGKKLATFEGAEVTDQLVPLPVHQLKAGTYWVEVNTDENHSTIKLVVNK